MSLPPQAGGMGGGGMGGPWDPTESPPPYDDVETKKSPLGFPPDKPSHGLKVGGVGGPRVGNGN